MSDDVTRLDFEHPACPGYECCGGGEMMPADKGDFVRYTDHARIVAAKDAEIAALTQRAERSEATANSLTHDMLRCIPADWKPYQARTWGHISNILAEYIGDLTAERDAARKALDVIRGNATCTLDQHDRVGPTWTSESGSYYDASYVIETAEETIRIIDATRAAEGGTPDA